MSVLTSPRRESESLNIQLLIDSIPALIHSARPDGYLDYFNKPWLEYLGVTLDKFVANGMFARGNRLGRRRGQSVDSDLLLDVRFVLNISTGAFSCL